MFSLKVRIELWKERLFDQFVTNFLQDHIIILTVLACTVIYTELLWLQKWSKNFRYRITPLMHVYGATLTPILTPNLRSFLLLKKISFNSENGVNFTPYMDCFYSFWSYFNSESRVKLLVTRCSFLGVILTPQYLGWFLLLEKSSLSSFLELK